MLTPLIHEFLGAKLEHEIVGETLQVAFDCLNQCARLHIVELRQGTQRGSFAFHIRISLLHVGTPVQNLMRS